MLFDELTHIVVRLKVFNFAEKFQVTQADVFLSSAGNVFI